MNSKFLKSSAIIGQRVQNPQGEYIGNIKDIIVLQGEATAFAVLSPGVFSGKMNKFFVVPIEVFGFAVQERTIIDEIIIALDLSKGELENLPGFDKDNWPQTLDSGFIDSVYKYHGLEQPRRPDL